MLDIFKIAQKKENTKKTKICVDCISLIHLAKIGIIKKISKNFTFVITNKIKEEIERELKENENVAKILHDLIENNEIVVENPKENSELLYYGLRNSELDVVECFQDGKCDIILSDDAVIRDNREILNLKVISTPSFILNLVERKILDKQKAIDALIMLRSERWFTEWVIDECIRRVKIS